VGGCLALAAAPSSLTKQVTKRLIIEAELPSMMRLQRKVIKKSNRKKRRS
jgi:hypothetical protein